MREDRWRLARLHRVGAAVHAVALSPDGGHALVGSERDLQLLDRGGNLRFRFERYGAAFSAVALSPAMDGGLALQRTGRVYRLHFVPSRSNGKGQLDVVAHGVWDERDDVYSLDYAPEAGELGGGLIALGHHGRGLAALDGHGRLRWRMGPRDGSVSRFRTWHAAISSDGSRIYAAPLGGVEQARPGHLILAIDARVGKSVKVRAVQSPVSLLASLPQPLGVAAVHRELPSRHSDRGSLALCSVTAYDSDLRCQAWSLRCPPGVIVTAMASAPDAAALVLGTNTGELWQVGAFTGRILQRHDLLYASTVLAVAVTTGGQMAAGLANGQIAFLERVGDDR